MVMSILFREKETCKERQDPKERIFLNNPEPIPNVQTTEFFFPLLDKETLCSRLEGVMRQFHPLPDATKTDTNIYVEVSV